MRIFAIACFPRTDCSSGIQEVANPLQEHAVLGLLLRRKDLVIDESRWHAALAGKRHDAIGGEWLLGQDRVLTGHLSAPEEGQDALQRVAAPAAVGAAMLGDQLVGHQLLQLFAELLVEALGVDRLLVGNLGRVLGHDVVSFSGPKRTALASPLVAPGAELRRDAEQSTAQEQ